MKSKLRVISIILSLKNKGVKMKKKGLLKYGIVAIFIIVLVIVFASMLIKNNSNKNVENAVTRFQWIQMVAEEFGITEYSNATPYFKDVNADSEYFASIQSAYEWGLLEKSSDFKGEEPADGEFIVLTAMKAVGKYKVQIYMGLADELKSKDYLELAIEKELVDKAQLNEYITKAESQIILEKASDLYLSELWVNDFEVVEYQDNVTEIENEDIDFINEDYSQILLSGNIEKDLNVGDAVIFADQKTGRKIAKEVVSINSDGSIELDETSIDKVLTSLVMSDISEVTVADILAYHNLDNDNLVSSSLGMKKVSYDDYIVKPVKQVNGSVSDKGFAISLSMEEDEISVGLTDNNTGISYELPVGDIRKINGTIDATIDVQRIYAGVQAYWSWQQGIEYIDIQLESDIQCSKELAVSEEIKIPLITTPLYFGNGIVGVDVEFNLVISVDGSVSIQASLPMRAGIVYEKGSGIRRHTTNSEYPESKVVANCSASCMLNLAPSLKIFKWDALDLDLDIGVSAIAEIETRTNSKVLSCADLSIALPIFTVSVSTGDSIEKLFDGEFSMSWEILTADNTLYKKGLHYEWYSNGESMLVDECTYNVLIPNIPYRVSFTSDFIDEGDYYSATGMVLFDDLIDVYTLQQLNVGDIYTTFGKTFVYQGIAPFSEISPFTGGKCPEEVCVFTSDSEGIYYTYIPGQDLTKVPADNTWDELGMRTFRHILDREVGVVDTTSMSLIAENYKFKIPKNAIVYIAEKEPDGYREDVIYTVEQSVEENVKDCNGNTLSNAKDIGADVTVDDNGYMQTIYVYIEDVTREDSLK